MLSSLRIINFKLIEDLHLPELGRVNLLAGKNNTGKTTLLEAVMLLGRGHLPSTLQAIDALLSERGERTFNKGGSERNSLEKNVALFSSLFSKRSIGDFSDKTIKIFESQSYLNDLDVLSNQRLQINYVYYFDEIHQEDDQITTKRTIVDPNQTHFPHDLKVGLRLADGDSSIIYDLDTLTRPYNYGLGSQGKPSPVQFIRANEFSSILNPSRWDSIALTEKEDVLLEALRIIEPKLDRLTYVGDFDPHQRVPVVKLRGSDIKQPLQSMGDGMNRLMTLILALVNAENGYLLVDEFENGLHFSIHSTVWKIIFEASQKLNVQVIATTHSEDCIKGFQSCLSNDESGKLIRLDRTDNAITPVYYNAEELKIATANDIEVR